MRKKEKGDNFMSIIFVQINKVLKVYTEINWSNSFGRKPAVYWKLFSNNLSLEVTLLMLS